MLQFRTERRKNLTIALWIVCLLPFTVNWLLGCITVFAAIVCTALEQLDYYTRPKN